MRKLLPLLCLAFGLLYIGSKFRPAPGKGEFDLKSFGEVPVLVGGRIKPIDTVARTSLLSLQGRQRVSSPELSDPFVATPAEWIADVLFNPSKADTYPTFRIDSPEVLALMGIDEAETKVKYASSGKRLFAVLGFLPSTHSRFSFNRLAPKLAELDRQAKLADPVEAQLRTPFQKNVVTLRDRLVLYIQLKSSVQPPDATDFLAELVQFDRVLPDGIPALRQQQQGGATNQNALLAMQMLRERYTQMERYGNLRTVPPPPADSNPANWRTAGTALLESFETGRVNANVMAYAALGHAWRQNDAGQFNQIVRIFHDQLSKRYASALKKSDIEARFNAVAPFDLAMSLYVMAFLAGIFSWLWFPRELASGAFWLLALSFALVTAGIATRMWLEGRPPVTNLYSSALFVGWGAVLLCLVLEKIYRNAVGTVAGGAIGFATLLIADRLSLSGDTLEMMRAVLDSNFWLATHVVVITIGYSATFLAGFLAVVYVVRGVLTRSLDSSTADSLGRMVYGIVCFATLFSLVGTVLGGIWADQSWGRFWGWDPKENGALLIVMWNAVILHARWGGMVRTRGLMMLAIFGNVVTSWSWFGTNMLGVGLHSYGFMDQAFYWLVAFDLVQLAIIAIAAIPQHRWLSFRSRAA